MLELIAVDQEYRWRRYASSSADEQLRPKDHDDPSGLPVRPRLEDYWQRFGIVKSDDRIATDLLANEYRIRRRYGDNPTREEYLQRFPA
ncbi:MAG: hypothetical protein O3C40_01615 [Planctomycetota bacterium]|nr:hypothetical protein [Planctomycetota bacterium]